MRNRQHAISGDELQYKNRDYREQSNGDAKSKKKKFKNVFDKYIIKFNTVNKDLEKLKTDQQKLPDLKHYQKEENKNSKQIASTACGNISNDD